MKDFTKITIIFEFTNAKRSSVILYKFKILTGWKTY